MEPVYVCGMRTPHDHVEGLRPRQCFESKCNAMFAVCASCDRGQRYCSELCRSRQRRDQVRAAGKRYQSSEAGKRVHCRRQQAYRARHGQVSVTHQAMAPITAPPIHERRSLAECTICGQGEPLDQSLLPARSASTAQATGGKGPNFYVFT